MNERHWEINGNLDDRTDGLKNYFLFQNAILRVKYLFDQSFGVDLLNKVDFYVDNATADSGYTPIATVVLNRIVVVKLGTHLQDLECNIAYQFSHELMHIVFYAVWGFDKPKANDHEESICTAAALITIKMLYPEMLSLYQERVSTLTNTGYRRGVEISELVGYSMSRLMPLVEEMYCKSQR